MRDIYKALAGFEAQFEEVYGLSLNEAMILCALQEAQKDIHRFVCPYRNGNFPHF